MCDGHIIMSGNNLYKMILLMMAASWRHSPKREDMVYTLILSERILSGLGGGRGHMLSS